MHKIETNRKYIGNTDIYYLPDDTFFYVRDGGWRGYVTTEGEDRVCYAGVNLGKPTENYVTRRIIYPGYVCDIDIIEVERKHTLDEESLTSLEEALDALESFFADRQNSHRDFTKGLRLVDSIKRNLGFLPDANAMTIIR